MYIKNFIKGEIYTCIANKNSRLGSLEHVFPRFALASYSLIDPVDFWVFCNSCYSSSARSQIFHFLERHKNEAKESIQSWIDPFTSFACQTADNCDKSHSFDLGGNRTHDLRIRSTVTLPTELRGQTEKVGDDLGGELRGRKSNGTYECCAA